MRSYFSPGVAAAALLMGACASNAPVSDPYWRSTASDRADFATDNAGCSARATRVVPQPRADMLPGGATIVDNRIDRPPKRWVHPAAEGAYMDCMKERGWHLVQR
jgi:hypothetical protein